jgi:hypothetical protein
MINFLSGKKTYLLGLGALVVLAAYFLGYVDEAVANNILTVLGFGSIISLRAAISKVE